MPVMEYLERNAKLYGDEIALVELNPAEPDGRRKSWKEFTPALTAFFNHHCLPLQCVCPFPKPGL